MLDRFKFRVWNNYTNQYFDDSIMCISFDGDNDCVQMSGLFEDDDHRDQMGVIEQSTGLKDRNGTLIYEGDIVEYEIYIVHYGSEVHREKVYWDQDRLCFACRGSSVFPPIISDSDRVEVIGNIHENPELMEATSE